jgi:Ca2+-binding RTX toxin-like protein
MRHPEFQPAQALSAHANFHERNTTMKQKFPTFPPQPPQKYNTIYGTDNSEIIYGTPWDDMIIAGDGADILHDGGGGDDLFYGGKGDDIYSIHETGDRAIEYADEGYDTVYTSLLDYTLEANFEKLVLEGEAKNGIGNGLDNILIGNDKNNLLAGLDGDDFIDGGKGADDMSGGTGDDSYMVDHKDDKVWDFSGQGIDTVFSSVDYELSAHLENLDLVDGAGAIDGTGNERDNKISGNDSDNMLIGGGGRDDLYGGGGQDTMLGGSGNDKYNIDSGDDIVIEFAGDGDYDMVIARTNYENPLNVERMFLHGKNAVIGVGNYQDNTIIGSDVGNLLFGDAGDDTLIGREGDDTLIGGADNDTFAFAKNEGNDIVTDFKANGDHDVIEIQSDIFKDFADMLWSTKQVGNDTVIKLDAAGSTVITLQNVDMSTLQAQDFNYLV